MSAGAKAALLLLLAAALFLAARLLPLQEPLSRLTGWLQGSGPWGPVLFVLCYVLGTVLLVPGSLLTLGAGAAFGLLLGSLVVSIGSTAGATCAFLVGRHLARDLVARRLERHPRLAALDELVARDGWRIVALTRLTPLFPFTLLNYAFGLTAVRLRDYLLASWAGMLPATVLYVYLGSLVRAGALEGRSRLEWLLYGVGLVGTVALVVLLGRAAGRALGGRFRA